MQKNSDKLIENENKEERNIEDGFTPLDQLVSPVGPQMIAPFTSVNSQEYQAGNMEDLHLFGQSQFHNNLGPVYAVPTYPKQHEVGKSPGQPQGNSGDIALYGQSQFHDNSGPVYALPTYPWPHGHNQGAGTSQANAQGHHQNMVNAQWQQHWGVQPYGMAYPSYCCGCYRYPVRSCY